MKTPLRVERCGFSPELLKKQPAWDALLAQSTWPSIYSSFDYVYTACTHFTEAEEYFFLFISDEHSGELLAIFPLSLWIHDLFEIDLRVVAHATTTSFSDVDKPTPIIHRDHEAACWKRFADYFHREFREWDLIDFDSTVADSFLSSSLRQLFPRPQYCPKSVIGPEYPLVKLDGDWEQFWNAHRTVRRKTRRIEKEIGDRLAYIVTDDPAEQEKLLDEYIATERLGWKIGQGVSEEKNEAFYRSLLPKLAEKGQVWFGMMYDGNTVMSAVIAYVYGQQLYFALCTYNPAYAHLSAGGVNWTRMVEHFHGKGLVAADFLSGGAGYIYPLADRIGKTQDITIHRLSSSTVAVGLRYVRWKLSMRSKRARLRRRRERGPAPQRNWPERHTLGISVEKVRFDTDLRQKAGEWEELLQRSSRPTIYSSFDYVETSCRHFRKNEELRFLFFRETDSGKLLAIFPISIWNDTSYGIHVRTVEHGITTTYTDVDKPYPIIDRDSEERCWQRFRNYFHREYRNWDVIAYDEVFPGSYLNKGLKGLFRFPFYYTKNTSGPESPIMSLAGEWAAFESAHPNLRKKSRRIEKKIGEGFSYVVTSDPADVERCLNEYIATEEVGWKAGEGVSKEENQKFYHDLLPRLAEKGQVFFGMMYDGDTVISAEISFTYGQLVYFALGTYNPEYKNLSPGSVSTSRFMQYFYGKGFTEGDFLAGFAHYVNPWASRIETTVDVVVRRMGWKNWYLACRHLLTKLKRKVKHLLGRKG